MWLIELKNFQTLTIYGAMDCTLISYVTFSQREQQCEPNLMVFTHQKGKLNGPELTMIHNWIMNYWTHANQIETCLFSKWVRPTFNWKTAKQILISFATADSTTAIEPLQTFQCYFVLGKIAEKQNPAAIRDILENYLLAEQQLFDCEDDDTLLSAKIEINFRITASIYKYVRRVENAVLDEPVLTLLWQVLKRDKGRIFSDSQLASRPNYAEAIDENANKVDVPNQSPVSVVQHVHFTRIYNLIRL